MLFSKLIKKFAAFFFFLIGFETFQSEVLHLNWISYKSEIDKYGSIAASAIFYIAAVYFIEWYNAPKKKKDVNESI